MARPTMHEQLNDGPGAGSEVRLFRKQIVQPSCIFRIRARRLLVQKRGERQRAEPATQPRDGIASRDSLLHRSHLSRQST